VQSKKCFELMCKEATKTTKTIAAATGAITALTADS
jgi:hypothetical protein